MQLNEFQSGLVVGLIMASASFNGDQMRARLQMRSTDRARIEMMHTLMGGTTSGPYIAGHGSEVYVWSLSGNALREWIPFIEERLPQGTVQRARFENWRNTYSSPTLRKPVAAKIVSRET